MRVSVNQKRTAPLAGSSLANEGESGDLLRVVMIESVLYIGDPNSNRDPVYCVTLDLNRLSITKD